LIIAASGQRASLEVGGRLAVSVIVYLSLPW